ncbi:hypothetical protein AYI70_g11456 [Smittium culicis]|uniref:Uncharacterized protein n=1 Tax=Smittium culicis TaxID=133412 RepID=A0A1R1X1R8_9FUNG|nr:hypothetical protein AYI70_g11456 [Smittium culicis]
MGKNKSGSFGDNNSSFFPSTYAYFTIAEKVVKPANVVLEHYQNDTSIFFDSLKFVGNSTYYYVLNLAGSTVSSYGDLDFISSYASSYYSGISKLAGSTIPSCSDLGSMSNYASCYYSEISNQFGKYFKK